LTDQGFSGFLDDWILLVFSGFESNGILLSDVGFWFFFGFKFIHSSGQLFFGHWIRITYQSYLTIQTYNPTVASARE
jgi:hypothetical protein